MKSFIFLISLLFLFVNSDAQINNKDYVITISGDTLWTTIHYNALGKLVYRSLNDSNQHLIDSTNVKAFFRARQKPYNFIGLSLPGGRKFNYVGILEKGKIELYELVIHGFRTSTTYWYASKDGRTLEVCNQRQLFGVSENLKENFVSLIQDNSSIKQMFDRIKKYDIHNIRNLVKCYNTINGKAN